MTPETVFKQFRQQGFESAGNLYLPPSVALTLVDAADRADLAVLGLEGFVLESGGLRPRLDLIADYSSAEGSTWADYRRACNSSARTFLRALPDTQGILIAVVLQPSDEWRGVSPRG